MLYLIAGIIIYICLHCLAKQVNVIDYVRENKVTLVLTTLIVLCIHLFGKTASAAVLMALLMPMMAAYSIPSILAKAKELWERLMKMLNIGQGE
jgi:hypothetical protein